MTHDPTRDCEHGRLKGKCDVCDLQAEVERLKATLALYKMAEDAVTIGLSYNDWPKIGCVNHDCDQCKAVPEPVAWMQDSIELYVQDRPSAHYTIPLYTAPQPVPVKTYHDGKPWPVAPKPWMGLTETEVEAYDSWADFQVGCGRQTLFDMVRDIEAKLKEKNHA
jgi:hypothetical protein